VKIIFEKFIHGLSYGLGFGIVLGAIYYYVTEKMTSEMANLYSLDPDLITIDEHRKIERDGKLLILGGVTNTSESSAKGVTINVELFLEGEFVKQCEESINGSVTAGESRNFELSCGGGCKKNPIVEHDSYEVYVTGY